ncbi:MAG: DNA repair protein RadC [Brumimicrobium sp.]
MYNITTSIKTWAEDDRPREKLQIKGKHALSDAELLAIVIGSGTRRKSAVDIAKEILQSNGNNLYELGKMTRSELMSFSGIGEAKATGILAVLELGRRRAATNRPVRKRISKSSDCFEILKPLFQDLDHEEFRIVGLTKDNRIIGTKLISKGGRSSTVVDGKLIFKELLDMKASGCILAHNHPSGNLKPSEPDIRLTNKLTKFGVLIDMPVLDHIIVADNGYYSFADNGIL